MPKRNPVSTTYQKATRRNRSRSEEWAAQVRLPQGLSPLAQYVESEMDSGIPVEELIWQFQEYDCEHVWEKLGRSPDHEFDYCQGCGRIEKHDR